MTAENFDAIVIGAGQAGKPLTLELARAGWKIALIERIERHTDGDIEVHFVCQDCTRSVRGSHLLVAIGRRPNTENLNLGAAGVKVDKAGYVQADDALRTNVPGIYALGDIKGGPAFTHISYDDYRILRDQWLHKIDARIGDRLVPNTMFIDPQLGQPAGGHDRQCCRAV